MLLEEPADTRKPTRQLGPACVSDGLELFEQARRDHLTRQRAAQVGDRLESTQLRNRRLGRADPADTQTTPEQLAQRADAQDRRTRRQRGDGGWRRAVQRERLQGVVL